MPCIICGYYLVDTHHIIPKQRGRTDESKNHTMNWHTSIGDMSVETSKKFRTAEYGTNLLRCCKFCHDLWLENLFKMNYLREILGDKKC